MRSHCNSHSVSSLNLLLIFISFCIFSLTSNQVRGIDSFNQNQTIVNCTSNSDVTQITSIQTSMTFIGCSFLSIFNFTQPRLTLSSNSSTLLVEFISCQFSYNPYGAVSISSTSVLNSNLSLSFVECEFTNNKAENGSAINIPRIPSDNRLSISISSCNFQNNIASSYGGALYFSENSLTMIENTTFTSNSAGVSGGAIYLLRTSSSFGSFFSINGVNFTSNSADSGSGGAISLFQLDFPFSILCSSVKTALLIIVNSDFYQNSATNPDENGNGGALSIEGGRTCLNSLAYFIQQSTFGGNQGNNGGAISFSPSVGNFQVTECQFNNNLATLGGAIFTDTQSTTFSDAGVISIYSSNFTDNTAVIGGGVMIQRFMSFTEVSFTSCSALEGGAIFVNVNNNEETTFFNSDFTNNSAHIHGGGIYAVRGNLGFIGSWFENNSCSDPEGGTVFSLGGKVTLNVENSDFLDNDSAAVGTTSNSAGITIVAGEITMKASRLENTSIVVEINAHSFVFFNSTFTGGQMIIEKGDVNFNDSDINSTLVYLSASDNAILKNTTFRGQESLYLLGLETSLLITDCLFLKVSNMTIVSSEMVRNHFFHSNFYLSNSTVTSGDFKNSSFTIIDSLNLSNVTISNSQVRLSEGGKLYLHSSYFIAGALDNSTRPSTSSVILEAGANFTFDSSSFCEPLPITCEAEAIVIGDVIDGNSILSTDPCVVGSKGFHPLPDSQKNTFALCSRLVFSFHFNNLTSGLLTQIQLAPPRNDHMHTCSHGNISIGISFCPQANQTLETEAGQVWQSIEAFSISPLQLQYLWNSSSPSLPTPKVDQDYCVTFRLQDCGRSSARVTISSEFYPTTISRGLINSTVPSLLNVQNVGISYLLVDEWNQPYQHSTTKYVIVDNDNTVRATLNESLGSFLVSGHSVLTSNWQIRRKLTLMIAQVKPNDTGFIIEQGGDNLEIMVVSLPWVISLIAVPCGIVLLFSIVILGGRYLRRAYSFLSAELHLLREIREKIQRRQKAWVIPASEVQWKSKIASGGRAEIWRCRWTGKDFVGKKYNRQEYFGVKDNKCCRLTHPSFIRLYGVGTTQEGLPFLLMDFKLHGDLMSFLQHNNGLSAAQVNSIVRTLAEGLLFLHSQKVPLVLYHLNPRDILITGTGIVKISNFMRAKPMSSRPQEKAKDQEEGESIGLLQGHRDIEDIVDSDSLFEDPEGPLSGAADVYSLGLVFWVLATGKPQEPFSSHSCLLAKQLLKRGQRPDLNPKWPEVWCKWIDKCWHVQPNSRPSISEVIEALE